MVVTKGKSKGFVKRPAKPSATTPGNPIAPSNIPQASSPPVQKPLRQRLLEASAALDQLQISSAMSRPCDSEKLAAVIENKDGKLAILGLDFGTAFTKAVVRWSNRHYVVDWSDAVEGEDYHLLASVFSEAPDGECMLGANAQSGWSICEGIKLQLLASETASSPESMADAVIFIALAFRYVDRWLRRTIDGVDSSLRWRLHVGLPTNSWDNDATTETFKTVAQAARLLACKPGPVTGTAALAALRSASKVDRPAVDVLPEFACQIYSYLQSPERKEDLHALVDIGAGTIDIAYFNVYTRDGDQLLPIFASKVDKLGAHYLIAALSGPEGKHDWKDEESSLADEDVGRKVGCSPNEVCDRRSLYLSSVADAFNSVTVDARKGYPTSPAFRHTAEVRLFLCGGGSRIPCLKKRFGRIAKEAKSHYQMNFQVSELVKPRDVVGTLQSGFDRLSVAYGLSQLASNIGHVVRSATLDPVIPRGPIDAKHRDDDR